ncbi:MAG: exosortase system-associated protein, TIGR04073 family, partial [Methylovulum sp.]|nr:exosortase system-associated protein, TIGR04073 family [Methylovulum sp.]
MTTPIRFFIALFLAGSLTVPAAHADQDYRNADMPTNQPDEALENQSYDQKLVDKTFNAISNLSTGVLEVPKNVINTTNDSNIIYGLTGGLFKGLLNTVGRLSVGVADLLTAPIPTKPITYPLHAWENGKEDTRYGNIFELDEFQENKP